MSVEGTFAGLLASILLASVGCIMGQVWLVMVLDVMKTMLIIPIHFHIFLFPKGNPKDFVQ